MSSRKKSSTNFLLVYNMLDTHFTIPTSLVNGLQLFNPLSHMPILGSFNSAANNDKK